MKCSRIVLLLLLLCSVPLFAQAPWTGLLSPQRATDWTKAGVQGATPGALPSASWTQCGSTIQAGASAATINAAIQACGTDQYVQLGAGDFNGLSQITFGTKNNVALRGMGPDQTRLHFSSAASCGGPGALICTNGYQLSGIYSGQNTPCAWTSGYSQGSTQITISSSCGVAMPVVGDVIMLDQCDTGLSGYTPSGGYTESTGTCLSGSAVDNGNYFNCELQGGMSGDGSPSSGCAKEGTDGNGVINRFESESHIVTAVNGNTITLAEPIMNVNFNVTSGLDPEAWWYPVLSNIGVESLYIDDSPISSYTYGVYFINAANTWAYEVEVYNSYGAAVAFDGGSHHELANSYMYEDRYPDDQATQSSMTSYDLYINNIYQQHEDAVLFEGVSSGSVVAYNWFAQACNYQSSSAVCRSDAQNAGYRSHSNGNNFYLFEGNYGPGYMDDDDHGTGLSDTAYRNFFTGWEACGTSNGSLYPNGPCGTDSARASQTNAVSLPVYARYINLFANVLGTPGFHNQVFDNSSSNFYPNTYVYLMGSGEGFGGNVDSLVLSTAAVWGNWDAATNGVLENSSYTGSSAPLYPGLSSPSTTFPASFFLSGRPAWWPSSIPYPAIGPDVSNGNVGQVSGSLNAAGSYSGAPALIGATNWGNTVNAAWGGHVNFTPAGLCYINGGGTPDGTGPAITFSPENCYKTTGQSPAATPTFNPAGGTYTSAQSVTISDVTSGATIYYTTNGTTPTTSSSVYSGPITVSSSETIEAIATASGFTQSAVGSAAYTITLPPPAATPTFSPAGGAYSSAQSVTISDATSGATIYYTTNGSQPTTSSPVYSSPINVSTSETLQAIAAASGFTQSATASASYTIGGSGTISLVQEKVLSNNGGQIACNPTCPSFTVNSTGAGDLLFVSAVATGTGGGAQTNIASITCSSSCGTWVLPGAVCQQYSANTGGVDCGYVLSSTAGATLVTVTMSGNTPYGTVYFREYHTTQPAGFRFDTVQTALNSGCTSCATPNLTLSGQNDVLIASGAPGGGFTTISAPYGDVQTESYTLTALADHLNTSSGTGATITQNANDPAALYTIAFTDTPPVLPQPTFSPAAGTYSGVQSVTISDTVTGTTIYYTTNGTTPTTSSPVYTGAVSVSSSETVEAIATKTGYTQSPTASAAYTINLPPAATPTFSPAGGSYSSAQSVTISDTSSGATIYYTTNGTTPTTSSSVYSSPINVSTSETLEAMAVGGGFTQSGTASASYTIASGTISLVQEKVLSNNGGQIVCNPNCPAFTVNSTGAGDLLFVSAVATGTGGGTQTNIASISCAPNSCGTWVLPGAACQKYNASTGGVDCGYVLSSTAGATSVTVTMSGNTPYGTVYFREYHTTQPTGFRFDTVQTAANNDCTSCATPNLTLSGQNDVLIASGAPGGGFTSISAPYGDVQTESYTATALGDRLNTSSGVGATITQNANNPATLYTIAFTDTPAAQLSGTVVSSSAAVTLSSGTTSWAFFDGYDTNASGTAEVSNVSTTGGSNAYGGDARAFSWTGGTPTSSSTNNTGGLWISATNGSFTFTVPANTTLQTVKVYVGGNNSGGTLTATLSDNSASAYSDSSLSSSGGYDGVYTLNYAAASAGQTLTIKWTQSSGTGNLNIQAASVSVP